MSEPLKPGEKVRKELPVMYNKEIEAICLGLHMAIENCEDIIDAIQKGQMKLPEDEAHYPYDIKLHATLALNKFINAFKEELPDLGDPLPDVTAEDMEKYGIKS